MRTLVGSIALVAAVPLTTLLAAYDSIPAAGSAVSDIIAAGIIPAAVEIMDGCSLEAVEAAVHPNFPPAIAILIVELDGPATEVDEQFQQVESICRRVGATTVELAKDDAHRAHGDVQWRSEPSMSCSCCVRV